MDLMGEFSCFSNFHTSIRGQFSLGTLENSREMDVRDIRTKLSAVYFRVSAENWVLNVMP